MIEKEDAFKAIIENGGFDCSMYRIQPDDRESEASFQHRLHNATNELHTDLLFFNKILDVICSSTNREELEHKMSLLFSKRLRRLLHGQERIFNYYFENGGMTVHQNTKTKRIIYVKLNKNDSN